MNVVHWAPPPLQIWAPDLQRLQRLADFSRNAGHPAAYFLLSELNRANPYDGSEPPAFAVSVNSWVTFSIDDSRPSIGGFWFYRKIASMPTAICRCCRQSERPSSDCLKARTCRMSILTVK